MGKFDDNFKENSIIHEITFLYSLKQNKKAEKVNRIII